MHFFTRYRLGQPADVSATTAIGKLTARQALREGAVAYKVRKRRHTALTQAVESGAALASMVLALEPAGVLKDADGCGTDMDLDLIIRDHSGKVLAVDVTVVGRPKDVSSRVADKLYGHRSAVSLEEAKRVADAEHEAISKRLCDPSDATVNHKVAERLHQQARNRVKGAYSAGYADACARAGMQARVVALSPAGGWYPSAISFLRDVRHSGDEAAAVGPHSEAVRFEHTHQTWQTTKYSTFVMHKAAAAIANATYGGVRAALAREARECARGRHVIDYAPSVVEPPRRKMRGGTGTGTPAPSGSSSDGINGSGSAEAGNTGSPGAQGPAEPGAAAARGGAEGSAEQQNCRRAGSKLFGETGEGDGGSVAAPIRSGVSNTTDIASATTPQAGESADTTSASTVGGGLSDKSKTRGVEPAAGAGAEQQEPSAGSTEAASAGGSSGEAATSSTSADGAPAAATHKNRAESTTSVDTLGLATNTK